MKKAQEKQPLKPCIELILLQIKIKTDAIIYLRTSPDVAFEILRKRDRPKKRKINKNYIELIKNVLKANLVDRFFIIYFY